MAKQDQYARGTQGREAAGTARLSGSAQAQQKVGQAVDQAHDAVAPVIDGAQDKVGQVVDQAKQQTTSLLETRKDQAADTLYTVAHALRQTGQQLREQEQAPVAGVADQVATRVESVSSYLHGRDVRQIVDETEDLARQRPAVFVGGALALGVLAARFLKSSRRKAITPPGQTIPAERALVETPMTPAIPATDDAPSSVSAGAAGATRDAGMSAPSDDPLTPAAVRVSSDEPLPAVIENDSTLTTGAS